MELELHVHNFSDTGDYCIVLFWKFWSVNHKQYTLDFTQPKMDKLRLTKIINNNKLSCAVFITIIILIQLSEANPERKKAVSLILFSTIEISTE